MIINSEIITGVSSWHKLYNITRMDIVDVTKEQKPHRDEKCQFKVIHGSSVDNQETFTPQGGTFMWKPLHHMQMAPKQYFTQLQGHTSKPEI